MPTGAPEIVLVLLKPPALPCQKYKNCSKVHCTLSALKTGAMSATRTHFSNKTHIELQLTPIKWCRMMSMPPVRRRAGNHDFNEPGRTCAKCGMTWNAFSDKDRRCTGQKSEARAMPIEPERGQYRLFRWPSAGRVAVYPGKRTSARTKTSRGVVSHHLHLFRAARRIRAFS